MSAIINLYQLYRPEYDQMLIEHFSLPPYIEVQEHGKIRRLPNPFPTLEGFAAKIDVSLSTLRQWAIERLSDGNLRYPGWSRAYSRAKLLQKNFFTTNSLQYMGNSNVAGMIAYHLLGWGAEKSEAEKAAEKHAETVTAPAEITPEQAHEQYVNFMQKTSKIKGLT